MTKVSIHSLRLFAVSNPITTFLIFVLSLSWSILTSLLLLKLPPEPALLVLTFVGMLGTSALITYWQSGTIGTKKLFAGLLIWRVPLRYYFLVIFAIPMLSIVTATAMGTFQVPPGAWSTIATNFFASLISSALVINIWEETAWSGFV